MKVCGLKLKTITLRISFNTLKTVSVVVVENKELCIYVYIILYIRSWSKIKPLFVRFSLTAAFFVITRAKITADKNNQYPRNFETLSYLLI